MGVESATFITDFDPTLPTSTDLRSQGDDHIRLLKTVLKDNFPTASKAWYNPTTVSKSADFTVVAADMNKTFLIDTSGGLVNMTLGNVFSAGDAGWECFFIKTTIGVNPVLVKPAAGTLFSGSLAGLTAARRSIPNIRIQCLWTGNNFIISRAIGAPIGSALDLHLAALPTGFEWPNGQTLGSASTNYPEFFATNGSSGVVLDVRGRVGIPLDNLGGSAAGRLAGGIITGTAVGNVGGTDTVTLDKTMIPTGITSANTGAIALSVTSAASVVQGASTIPVQQISSGSNPWTGGSSAVLPSTGNIAIGSASVTSNNTGGLAHSNLQPSIMVAKILVVE